MDMKKVRAAYQRHKWDAGYRGLGFKFTFEQWVAWWHSHLGPDWFKLRGRGPDQYCMARKGDKGPYEPNNVKCITYAENRREQTVEFKLTKDTALAIYKAKGTQRSIGEAYGVSSRMVRLIKNKQCWKWALP